MSQLHKSPTQNVDNGILSTKGQITSQKVIGQETNASHERIAPAPMLDNSESNWAASN